MARHILILQTGDVPAAIRKNTGNFDRMFLDAADYGCRAVDIIRAHADPLPVRATGYAGIIVTGSPAMVSDREPWSEAAASWLRRAIHAGAAVLGVCYGHQLVAHALGGLVSFSPTGKELGTHTVNLKPGATRHPWLTGLPHAFPANLAHSQSVLALPAGARVLAFSHYEPYQIVAYGKRALTLQFHPEFTGPIMQAYMDLAAAQAQSIRPANLGAPGLNTPAARQVLQNFVNAV